MTEQTATTLEIGLTITTDSNSLFEDTDGANVEASMEKFDAMLLDAVSERFPEATVELVDRGYVWDVTVDSALVNGNDTPAAFEATQAIQAIADQIYQDGEWIVEASR